VSTGLNKEEKPEEPFKWINFTYGIDTYVILNSELIDYWRREMLNETDKVLKSMREVLV